MNKEGNRLGRYSSKVKRVNIPVPSFEYVHKSWFSDELGSPTPGFMIGRDRIIEKLKTWLIKEKTSGGSYLIAGYRGMGKTSFVDRVLYELVGEPLIWSNLAGLFLFIVIAGCIYSLWRNEDGIQYGCLMTGGCCGLALYAMCKYYYLKELYVKTKYRIQAAIKYIATDKLMTPWGMVMAVVMMWRGLTSKEWDRIDHLIYGANEKYKRYSHISVSVNLGQEILDERNILCVVTAGLYNKYRAYVLSPIANMEMWTLTVVIISVTASLLFGHYNDIQPENAFLKNIHGLLSYKAVKLGVIAILFFLLSWHQIRILFSLSTLRRRIDAELKSSQGIGWKYKDATVGGNREFNYPVATVRDIESRLIHILDRIYRFPAHPTIYFVFDELDKVETHLRKVDEEMPEFSNEKYLKSGGTSRKRKFMVMHLLANMKYFTTTAKAKFIFIAGREMYDGYLADLTDRESAVSSLFNGIIYVESFLRTS